LSQKHGCIPLLIRFDYHQITYGYKPMRLRNRPNHGTLFSLRRPALPLSSAGSGPYSLLTEYAFGFSIWWVGAPSRGPSSQWRS
jgi:hypothetical protein